MSVCEDAAVNGISSHGSWFQVKQRLWPIQSLNYLMGKRKRVLDFPAWGGSDNGRGYQLTLYNSGNTEADLKLLNTDIWWTLNYFLALSLP